MKRSLGRRAGELNEPEPSTGGFEGAAQSDLRLLDKLLPKRVVGFYVFGSSALGEYRPGRSDIDFLAVLDRALVASEIRILRIVHALSGITSGLTAVARGHSPLTGTCNGAFVVADDMGKPVGDIVPVASHTGVQFSVASGFDVNPVMWKILLDHGVRLRGRELGDLAQRVAPEVLRRWNLDNLEAYWRPMAEQVSSASGLGLRLRPRWWTSGAVPGAPRLHYTIATGEILSKESAGEYALNAFAPQWHPIVREGLAYRKGRPLARSLGGATRRFRRAGEFVLEVVEAANRL